MLTRLQQDELFHPPPTLETERLILSPLRPVHANELFLVHSDPAVARQNDEQAFESVEATALYISGILRNHELRVGLSWVLISKHEGGVVGSISIHAISWSNARADVGFTLASRHWRRRLMSEALASTVELAFARLRLRKLCAQNTLGNDACHALLTKLGFVQEGVLREHAHWNERSHDLRQYGLLARDWFERDARVISKSPAAQFGTP
jgi:ribosomal-protein-alanine N-acetyltransferase